MHRPLASAIDYYHVLSASQFGSEATTISMHHELTGNRVLQRLDTEITVEEYAKSLLSRIEARDKVEAWEFLGRGSSQHTIPLQTQH